MERWEGEQRPAGGRRSRPNGFYPFSSARRRADALRASLPAVRQQKALRRSRGAIVFILIYCR